MDKWVRSCVCLGYGDEQGAQGPEHCYEGLAAPGGPLQAGKMGKGPPPSPTPRQKPKTAATPCPCSPRSPTHALPPTHPQHTKQARAMPPRRFFPPPPKGPASIEEGKQEEEDSEEEEEEEEDEAQPLSHRTRARTSTPTQTTTTPSSSSSSSRRRNPRPFSRGATHTQTSTHPPPSSPFLPLLRFLLLSLLLLGALGFLLLLLSSASAPRPDLSTTHPPVALWPLGEVPLAKGGKEEDVPTLTPFYPEVGKWSGVAVVIMPGGGYNWLAMVSRWVGGWRKKRRFECGVIHGWVGG